MRLLNTACGFEYQSALYGNILATIAKPYVKQLFGRRSPSRFEQLVSVVHAHIIPWEPSYKAPGDRGSHRVVHPLDDRKVIYAGH